MIRGRTLTWLATLLVWVLAVRTRITAAGLRGSISGRVQPAGNIDRIGTDTTFSP